MPSSSTDPAELLADLLLRLVEVLRARGGFTWDLLVRVTAGRTGHIELDGHRLALSARRGRPYRLTIQRPEGDPRLHFRAEGVVILDILRGRTTLDRALDENQIFVRAPLRDLLQIYLLVMNILADSPIAPGLRELCQEWERSWPHLPPPTELLPLESQRPRFGRLVREIPWALRAMEGFVASPPGPSGDG